MANEHVFQSTADPATFAHHCYDVLVVGAGPAGSSAAYHLARQGVDVLLVDRFAFPRDKRCGDGIVTAALEELALMGIADEVQARYSVSSHVALWLYGMKNITDCDASEHFTVGYVAPRKSFDALLCEHALQAGASWLDHVTVHDAAVEAGDAVWGYPSPRQGAVCAASALCQMGQSYVVSTRVLSCRYRHTL